MLYFNIILLIVLSGCTPKFKTGDCIREKGNDSFNPQTFTYEIKEVGQFSYCAVEFRNEFDENTYKNFHQCHNIVKFNYENLYNKVDCEK